MFYMCIDNFWVVFGYYLTKSIITMYNYVCQQHVNSTSKANVQFHFQCRLNYDTHNRTLIKKTLT